MNSQIKKYRVQELLFPGSSPVPPSWDMDMFTNPETL